MSQKQPELFSDVESDALVRILILGGGFAGVEVLKILQREFRKNTNVDVTLVSRDNFLLFTPMLPEVSSGMIEARHIATPIRAFCDKAKFLEASVESIDFRNKRVIVGRTVCRHCRPDDRHNHTLRYDYLVIALGSETNFYGMREVEKKSLTMKSLDDALVLRNHVISMLEQASVEYHDEELRKKLLTFVVVGGGFSGVETVGELNDFVRDAIKQFYQNIDEKKDVRILLLDALEQILPETSPDLSRFALEKLRGNGVEFMPKAHVTGAAPDSLELNDDTVIPTYTIIWTAGVRAGPLVSTLACDHDKGGRIVTNQYLEVPGHSGVFAIGDCAFVLNPSTGKPSPPTAQYAKRQARVAARNVIFLIKGKGYNNEAFNYKPKGMAAEIGKHTAVATIFGLKFHGFVAWVLWRAFYLSSLPTAEKKLRVVIDWITDLIFKHDVTMIKTFAEKKALEVDSYSYDKPELQEG